MVVTWVSHEGIGKMLAGAASPKGLTGLKGAIPRKLTDFGGEVDLTLAVGMKSLPTRISPQGFLISSLW